MDFPVDLSRGLCVCAANNLETIPAPLINRMEVWEVFGYVSEEKAVIAQRYLRSELKKHIEKVRSFQESGRRMVVLTNSFWTDPLHCGSEGKASSKHV